MNFDAFALIAELALGLLGFSSVAAAFGGREREFNYVERVRFFGIVVHSATPLFGSLAVFAISHSSLPESQIIFWASVVSIVLHLAFSAPTLAVVGRSGRDSTTSTEGWAVGLVWLHLFVALALYVASLLMGGAASLLIAAYASHLAMGIFILWRILMRSR